MPGARRAHCALRRVVAGGTGPVRGARVRVQGGKFSRARAWDAGGALFFSRIAERRACPYHGGGLLAIGYWLLAMGYLGRFLIRLCDLVGAPWGRSGPFFRLPGSAGHLGGPAIYILLAIGCWLLAIGYWLLTIGYWLLAIGYWRSGGASRYKVGYWLLSIGYCRRLAVFSSSRSSACCPCTPPTSASS
jgi:hypothetical protein